MKKPPRKIRYPADPSAMWRVISNVTPYTEEEIKTADTRGRLAFEKLRSGAGTVEDYDELAQTLNTLRRRLIQLGESDAILVSNAAAAAMRRCKERYEYFGKLGFDGPGMQEIMDALDLHTQMLEVSTEGEMVKAQVQELIELGMV